MIILAAFAFLVVPLQARTGIHFDLTINLGNMLTIISFIGGGLYFVITMKNRIDLLTQRSANMEEDLTQMGAETQQDIKNLSEVVVLQGRHDERITALQLTVVNQGKRLDDTIRRMNTFLDMKSVDKLDEDD